MDNGCNSGTFTVFNSTECTGDVMGRIHRDDCMTTDFISLRYQCSSYNDAEYLRQTVFQLANGHNAHDCNAPLKVVSFSRLGFCYPGNQVGSMGFWYEKANATAWRITIFNDAGCTSVNRTQEGTADGTCQGNYETDFVNANSLGSSAVIAEKSAGLMTIVVMIGAVLAL